jgi:hypothetical protein
MPDVFGIEGGPGAGDPRAKKPDPDKKKKPPSRGEPDMLYGTQDMKAGEGPKGQYVQYDNESGAVMLNLPPGFAKYKADLEEELMEEFYGDAAGGEGVHRSIDNWVKDWINKKAKEDPSVLEEDNPE